MEDAVGKLTHYFGNLGVAVAELTGELKVGDQIHIKGHTTDFTQTVDSLEIEHQKVEKAGPRDSAAFKVLEKVRPGDHIYRVEPGATG
jgi:putative protease